MEAEGRYWVTITQAARILGLSLSRTRLVLARRGQRLPGGGKRHYYPLEEIEKRARDPRRLRTAANFERRSARRKAADTTDRPCDLIDGLTATHRLGVCRTMLVKLVNSGQLLSYQQVIGRTKHWFSAADVEALRERRAQQKVKRQERAMQLPTRRPGGNLPRGGRVEVGDLSPRERYFGDLLTTRQVAWMLHITMRSVTDLRQNGRLQGVREFIGWRGKTQWHYWKKEVVALMNDPEYCARRGRYERYLSPEGRAARAAEIMQRQWEQIARLNRERRLRNALDDWLNEKW